MNYLKTYTFPIPHVEAHWYENFNKVFNLIITIKLINFCINSGSSHPVIHGDRHNNYELCGWSKLVITHSKGNQSWFGIHIIYGGVNCPSFNTLTWVSLSNFKERS